MYFKFPRFIFLKDKTCFFLKKNAVVMPECFSIFQALSGKHQEEKKQRRKTESYDYYAREGRSFQPCTLLSAHLRVYKILPSFHMRRSWLGVVIQWASAVFELRNIVSGIQIKPTMLLFRVSIFMVLLKRRRLSVHVWAKNISIWYSCNKSMIRKLK